MQTNGATMRVESKAGGKLRWMPRPGEKYVIACLVGGRYDTRTEAMRELKKRYGIDCQHHFGDEKRAEPNLFIPAGVDIVIIMVDAVAKMMEKVMKAVNKSGKEHLGVKGYKFNAQWAETLKLHGFETPPRWEGIDIDKVQPVEEAPKVIEPPRLVYVDPKLKAIEEEKEKRAKELQEILKQPPAPLRAPHPLKGVRPGTTVEPTTAWAEEFRKAREATGLSQGEFGKKIGKAQGVVSSWERGNSVPLWEWYVKLKTVLPSLSEPPDIKGRLTYEQTHGKTVFLKPGTVVVPPPATPYAPPGAQKTAKEAFGGAKPAEVPAKRPEPAPEPLVEVIHSEAQLMTPPPPIVAKKEPDTVMALHLQTEARKPTRGDERTITLRGGGTLTLSISVEILKLRGEDRVFVFDLIDKLADYEEKK